MTSEPTETPPESKHLFVLGFPDRHGADRAVGGLKELERSQFLSVRDHAIITKAPDGKLHIDENKDADHSTGRGAVTGGLAGAFVAVLSGPKWDRGRRRRSRHRGGRQRDSRLGVQEGRPQGGELMEPGRTLLLVAVKPADAARMHDAMGDLPELVAADRRWDAVVAGDSHNVLQDALHAWQAATCSRGYARWGRGARRGGGGFGRLVGVGCEVVLVRRAGDRHGLHGQAADAAGVLGKDDALGSQDLDAVRLEGGQEPLAELATRGPLLGRAHGAEDLEGHAVLSPSASTRSTRGASSTRRFQIGSSSHRLADGARPPRSPGRCRCRRRRPRLR